jgi:hypothetical protein
MSPPFCQQSHSHPPVKFSIGIARGDRWCIFHRLQELAIPCHCLEDGSVEVEVCNSFTALLVRSVVRQSIAPRAELVDWLERCWEIPIDR